MWDPENNEENEAYEENEDAFDQDHAQWDEDTSNIHEEQQLSKICPSIPPPHIKPKTTYRLPPPPYSPRANKKFSDADISKLKKCCGAWMKNLQISRAPTKRSDLLTQLKCPTGCELLGKFTFEQTYARCRFMVKGTYRF